jgi:DNA repair exonuclease SbcCD ATPase subunit
MMLAPQKYRQKISELTSAVSKLPIASLAEAEDALNKLQNLQDELVELKKRVKTDIDSVRENYKQETKGSIKDTIFAGHLGKDRANQTGEQTKEELKAERNESLKGYQEIHSLIDKRIEKTKSKKNELQSRIKELKSKRRSISTANSKTRVHYHTYIQSPQWREKAEEAKARAGNRCEVCNRSRAEVQLDAHHRTYERLGNEVPEDITVLCRDCHQLYEDAKRLPPPPSPQSGVCIRCKAEIKLNPQAPYCPSCYKVWKRFENPSYLEKVCHICGKDNESTITKPSCLDCYLEHRNKLEFSKIRG